MQCAENKKERRSAALERNSGKVKVNRTGHDLLYKKLKRVVYQCRSGYRNDSNKIHLDRDECVAIGLVEMRFRNAKGLRPRTQSITR